MCAKLLQSCLILCIPMCSLPGSSLHGILHARILEWVSMPSLWDLPDPGIESTYSISYVSCIGRLVLCQYATVVSTYYALDALCV